MIITVINKQSLQLYLLEKMWIEKLEASKTVTYEKIENIAFKDEFFPEVNLNKRFVVMADVEVIQSKS